MDELTTRNPSICKQDHIKDLNMTELNVIDNFNVTDVSHMVDLQTLRIAGYCGVDQQGITGLTNVTELDISYNTKITDVSFMPLIKLKAQGPLQLTSLPPSITELDISNNPNIKPDGLPNLKRLIARGNCPLDPDALPVLELLDVEDNPTFN